MKIGVVGSGIAGLTAAYELTQRGHDVSIFEKLDRLGLAAHTIELPTDDGKLLGDVPSRMFNGRLWPRLNDLYGELGVSVRPVNPTQSFGMLDGSTYLTVKHAGHPTATIPQWLRSRPRSLLLEAARLAKQGTEDLEQGVALDLTLQEYLSQNRFSDPFVSEFLYPTLSSTVCTCSYEALRNYPARIVLESLRRLVGGSDEWLLRTEFGSLDVAQRLTKDVTHVLLATDVTSIFQRGDFVILETANHGVFEFDHVVVATQANRVSSLVSDLVTAESKTLKSFRYEDVMVIVHRDPALMPRDSRSWATFNMICRDQHAAMCTVWMNRFHSDWTTEQDYFQTINPQIMPRPEWMIAQINLQRPVVRTSSMNAWERLGRQPLVPGRRIWYCGSYGSYGIPLLESGVVSAQGVVQSMDAGRESTLANLL